MCWTCQQNTAAIVKAVNRPNDEKSQVWNVMTSIKHKNNTEIYRTVQKYLKTWFLYFIMKFTLSSPTSYTKMCVCLCVCYMLHVCACITCSVYVRMHMCVIRLCMPHVCMCYIHCVCVCVCVCACVCVRACICACITCVCIHVCLYVCYMHVTCVKMN